MPNVKLSEKQEAKSLTLLISEPSCMANRGRAVQYYIQLKNGHKGYFLFNFNSIVYMFKI